MTRACNTHASVGQRAADVCRRMCVYDVLWFTLIGVAPIMYD